MTTVTRKQVGLKPTASAGGKNVATLPAGTPVTIDPTWAKVTAGTHQGWMHSADIGDAPQPVALGIYAVNSAVGQWREDWASGQNVRTGIAPGIIHRYQPWTGAAWAPWDTAWATDAAILGTMPLISWEGRDYTVASATQASYSNAAVLAGAWDKILVAWLTDAGKWGKPFLLRFFWEANGAWYPWSAGTNGNTPGSLIDAWRHVARLVRQYAPLARIVWCPGTSGSGWLPLEDCYPGDAYVDYCGLDFYNCGNQPHGWSGGWVPFSAIQPWYDRVVSLAPGKEIIVCETGCVPQGGDKAAWYAAIPAALVSLPAIRGVVAFDNLDPSGMDFRVSADSAIATIWKALAANPAMQGRLIPAPLQPPPVISPGPIVVPGPVAPLGVPGKWALSWSDEFDGAALDTSKWGANWLGSAGQVTPPVNDSEIAAYDPACVSVVGGELHLTAIANPVTVNGKTYPLRSGMIQSNNKHNFTYGCVEARMQFPSGVRGQSVWPALWTTGAPPWPLHGEIDLVEAYGTDESCSPHYHYQDAHGEQGPGVDSVPVIGSTTDMHTYAMTWEPGLIVWYYDGQEVYRTTTGVVSSPHFIILNLGMKGTQTTLPAVMRVQYVRVFAAV